MKAAVVAGIVLGIVVEIWTYVMGLSGWFKDPVLVNLFFLVILVEIVVLVALLRKTAAESGYGRQVANGLVAALVATAIIVPGSLLFTKVVFPNYFSELKAAHARILGERGMTPEQIHVEVESAAAGRTPARQAAAGAIGTIATGLAVSLVAGAVLRKK